MNLLDYDLCDECYRKDLGSLERVSADHTKEHNILKLPTARPWWTVRISVGKLKKIVMDQVLSGTHSDIRCDGNCGEVKINGDMYTCLDCCKLYLSR